MNCVSGRPINILLVDDSCDDIGLVREALYENRILANLQVASDGAMAIAMLKRAPGYEGICRPDIILLDLNIPKKSGMEVLAELKADKTLRRIPIVILTTSKNDQDVVKTYDLHANCFISKPIDFEEFIRIIKSIADFWLSVVKLPPNP